jgi:hypothetical protein
VVSTSTDLSSFQNEFDYITLINSIREYEINMMFILLGVDNENFVKTLQKALTVSERVSF